jgi:IS30 family transposase
MPEKLYVATAYDLKVALAEVLEPLLERLRELEVETGSKKHAYTVAEVADQIGYHPRTIHEFIREGRKDRRGKMRQLSAKEITQGQYRITPESLAEFLGYF